MKRILAVLSVVTVLAFGAMAQTPQFSAKGACCNSCCPDKCSDCCAGGCADCCNGK